MLDLDWQQPWFIDWAMVGRGVQAHWQETGQLTQALNAVQTAPVKFVPQEALPAGTAYEAFIFNTKQVPTRPNAHDFFNGLCWLRFPQTKLRLNEIHALAIAQQGTQTHRGPLRDALTLFDENAALLFAPETLWQAIRAKDWQGMFKHQRLAWAESQLVLFGHAALEKLIKPYKGITLHLLQSPLPKRLNDSELDHWLCQQLVANWIETKPYNPLPVMGLPGWNADNENPDFYTDKSVFRD